jgi:hypothetical protein
MPDIVKNIIITLGFTLIELCNGESVSINKLKARFYIGSPNVPFWEKRVYQLYITNDNNYGVFIQSDTLVSDLFIQRINSGVEPSPNVFISTNNSQLLPVGKYGAFDNLLPIHNSTRTGLPGIDILHEVLIDYAENFTNISHILISGGGYIIDNDDSKPFLFTDIDVINPYLDELSMGLQAKYLYPGEKLTLDKKTSYYSKVDWVDLNTKLYEAYKKRSKIPDIESDISLLMPIFKDFKLDNKNIELIELEVKSLAPAILLNDLGRMLLATNEYLNGALGVNRFVINLKIDRLNSMQYYLNINKAMFELANHSSVDLVSEVPYGIELFVGDFVALLEGRIQIWELATSNLRQWYLGDKMTSPVAFLYAYFSEQVRPDLASKVYETINAW